MSASPQTLKSKKVVIVGAGPAGLTAAYVLSKTGVEATVLEKDQVVGGISRTVNYRGYYFDIGGHRFFTKVKAVDDMWKELLAETSCDARGFRESTTIRSFLPILFDP